jgi:DNA-binding transcriptional ArsR family regulator
MGAGDPAFWYLLDGTRGGANRRRILDALRSGPSNAHRLAETLDLDYQTVRHHLGLLERNGAVSGWTEVAYARPYSLTGQAARWLEEAGSRPAAPSPGRWSRAGSRTRP